MEGRGGCGGGGVVENMETVEQGGGEQEMGTRGKIRGGKRQHLITIGTENNAPLAYATGTEHHHLIMITLRGNEDQ